MKGFTGAVVGAGIIAGAGFGWKYQFESWEKAETPKTKAKEMPKITPRKPRDNSTYLARAIQERPKLQRPKSKKYDAHWILERDTYTSQSTMGTLYHDVNRNGIVDREDKILAQTLELPYRNNQTDISSIPTGTYQVKPRISKKFKRHFEIKDVSKRTDVLFHTGNYSKDTKGCVIVGSRRKRNKVENSRNTMNMLNQKFRKNGKSNINLMVRQKRPTKRSTRKHTLS